MRLFVDSDTAAVVRRMQAVDSTLADARPALNAAADEIRRQLDARFDKGIRPQTSLDWRRRKGPGRPTLVFSGDLRRSLTEREHPKHVQRTYTDAVFVGTSDFVARLQRDGARGRKRNPASLPAPARKAVVEQFTTELLRDLR